MLFEHQLFSLSLAEKIDTVFRTGSRASSRLSHLRKYLLSSAHSLENTRLIMTNSFQVRPITFLYFEAGPRLYTFILSQIVLGISIFVKRVVD